jgi:hypothetical protein
MAELCWQPVDVAAYRAEAESFVSALDREHYLHFSGQQERYEIEPIYARHAGLFTREVVERLREAGNRHLVEFAVQGLIGAATRREQAALARREAELEITLDGDRMGFRASSVAQANEPDPERRAAIEAARNAALEEHLMPMLLERFERARGVARELGWTSVLALCEETSGIDLATLDRQAEEFLRVTDGDYERLVGPQLEAHVGLGFGRLRRADLPAFFRCPSLDRDFDEERLVPTLVDTLAGLGIDLRRQPGVTLDTEHRENKSPRAFCAAVQVPGEVYLVIARIGGRDDYAALFHEAGHTEHYAHVDAALPAEHRYFGDNSVTEGFAFLFEHLLHEPAWLARRLGVEEPEEIVAHARAVKLLFLRRYCAKLAYERQLHSDDRPLGALAETYSRLLSDATGVAWPREPYLSDVDPFFYVARYLRAWALETHLRRELRERFGEHWFEDARAGELLRSLWRHGQRLSADEVLGELAGRELDFSALLEELRPA